MSEPLQSPSTSPHREISLATTIYNNQYNAAFTVCEKFANMIGEKKMFTDLNFLILGPAEEKLLFTIREELRNFMVEIGIWNSECGERLANFKVANYSRCDLKFQEFERILLEDLKNKKNKLHLLIFDECQITTSNKGGEFLHRILWYMENNIYINERTIILFVTATPSFITRALDEGWFSGSDSHLVDIEHLNNVDPLHFGSPSYRHLKEVPAWAIQGYYISNTNNGTLLLNEYRNSLSSLYVNSDDMFAAKEFIRKLLPPREEWNAPYKSGDVRNKVIIVKFNVVKESNAFVDALQAMKPPFEVLHMNNLNRNSLSPLALQYLPLSSRSKLELEDFSDIPAIIVCTQTMEVGVHFPRNCILFDVRAAFGKSHDESEAVHILGRCAGYHKDISLFLPFLDKLQCPKSSVFNVNSIDWRKGVSPKSFFTPTWGDISANHPEKIYHAFSRSIRRAIVLTGPPQYGKTGVYFCVLEILFKRHFQAAKLTPSKYAQDLKRPQQPQELATAIPAGESEMDFLSQVLCDLNLTENSLIQRDTGMFVRLHEHISKYRSRQNLNMNEHLFDTYVQRIFKSYRGRSWKIIDAGCGMHGILETIDQQICSRNIFKKFVDRIDIFGIDICVSIQNLKPLSNCIRFYPIVSDDFRRFDDNSISRADIIIFTTSILEQDWTTYIVWSFNNLQPKGYLIIADNLEKYPPSFQSNMVELGWVLPTEDFDKDCNKIIQRYDAKYQISIFQKPLQGNINKDALEHLSFITATAEKDSDIESAYRFPN